MTAITGTNNIAMRIRPADYRGISFQDRRQDPGIAAKQQFRSTTGSTLVKGLVWTAGLTAAVGAGISARYGTYNFMPADTAEYILNNVHNIAGGITAAATLGTFSLGILMIGSRISRNTILCLQNKIETAFFRIKTLTEETSYLKDELKLTQEALAASASDEAESLLEKGWTQANACAPDDANGLRDALINILRALEMKDINKMPADVAVLVKRLNDLTGEASIFSTAPQGEISENIPSDMDIVFSNQVPYDGLDTCPEPIPPDNIPDGLPPID